MICSGLSVFIGVVFMTMSFLIGIMCGALIWKPRKGEEK